MSITASDDAHEHDLDYTALLEGVRRTFHESVNGEPALFMTDASGLNELYLENLPHNWRQHHTCHACRRFIERFGGLAYIGPDGIHRSALWMPDEMPAMYRASFEAMDRAVAKARVTSVFYSSETTWGTPRTPPWSHIAVTPPKSLIFRERARTPHQAMAASRESHKTVQTALATYRRTTVAEALRLFESDVLSRSERFVGPMRWLLELHSRPKGRLGENVLWRAVATAPEGYMHPKSSVIGPLLDAIEEQRPFDEVQRMFSAMLHPLLYQRPQTSPAVGNIRQAEQLVEKLGVQRSLERRFARLEEVLPHAIWRPRPPAEATGGGGVFGHLRPRDVDETRPLRLPSRVVTWRKFKEEALPRAHQVEFRVPHGRREFIALLTAVHADAPLIHKWGNPVSCYVYHGGSEARSWGLVAGRWTRVSAVVPRPNLWGERPMPHLGEGDVIVLEGAADERTGQGNALFPETLSDDLHAARRTIEAYSKKAAIEGHAEASACGFGMSKGTRHGVELRVHDGSAWSEFTVDRWD